MERFWVKVRKTDTCWLWTAAVRSGYGAYKYRGKVVSAHRFIWEYSHQCSVLSHIDVCHSCDNPLCVRLDHLFLGTRKDNMVDCRSKGRLGPPPASNRFQRGKHNPNTKLSDADCEAIKARYANETVSMRELGESYGVDHSRIWQVVRGDR